MLKDQFMEFYANPFRSMPRLSCALQLLTVPMLALCLALPSAPARAQQTSQAAPDVRQRADALSAALGATNGQKSFVEQLMDRQHLPTPLVGRISPFTLRAASGAYDRRVERATMDDVLHPLTAPRLRKSVSTVQTTSVSSTVQTSDLTYPGYTFSTQGTLTSATPSNINPFFSPSERFIYFASNRTSATNPAPGAEYHIWAISPSGAPSSLVQLTGLSTQATTSAAGEAFKGEQYPYVVNDNQIVYTQLVANAQGVTHYDLYVANLGTNGITGTPTQITGLAVHPDGTTYQLYQTLSVTHPSFVNGEIAFAGTALTSSETPIVGATSHIYLYTASGGTFTQLTTGPASDENPALSPDQPVVAFDSNVSTTNNAANYTLSGNANTGVLVSTGTTTTRDIVLALVPSGTIVNRFTNTSVTGTASNNIEPFWSQPTTNNFVNTSGQDLYLFFSSDRNDGVYDIYFLRAQDTTPTPPSGQLVNDLEGQDNQSIGKNIAARINTSSFEHHTNDSLATPINNMEPTISSLKSVYSVVYISNRYLINNVSDNPLDPGNELTLVGKAGYPALPAAAQDNEPTSLTTDPATAAQGSDEILASQIIDIAAPTLLPYDTTTGEVIHVVDQTASIGKATRLVGPGNTAQFIMRLSDRQTGIGKAFLQIKDPNSKYQQVSGTPLEHKVYTRYGGQYASYPNLTMHYEENDESTTLFNLFTNFAFGLNSATPVDGDQVFGASIAGSSGGQTIETGGLLVYPRVYTEVNTTVVTAPAPTMVNTTNGPITYTTVVVNASTTIGDFVPGDYLSSTPGTPTIVPLEISPVDLVYSTMAGGVTTTTVVPPIVNNTDGTYTFLLTTNPPASAMPMGAAVNPENAPITGVTTAMAGGTSGFTSLSMNTDVHFQIGDTLRASSGNPPVLTGNPMVLNGISGPSAGVYTFAVSDPSGNPVQGGVAMGATVQVVARFDPQGQEVDCEAIDAGIGYSSGGAPVTPTVSNFTVPKFTPGYEDAAPLDYNRVLDITNDTDSQTGPINRASGNSVWLQLEPFIVDSSVSVATLAGATVIPIADTSGIVPGDTVQIGTETAIVASLAVAAQQTGIPNGTPELVLESAALAAHAAGDAVTLVTSPSGGVLYSATWVTPTTPSDYFIDAIAFDNAAFPLTNGDNITTPNYTIGSNYNNGTLNWRIYDNVWGFSTLPFTPSSGPAVLVVSDYALPQKFFQGRFGTTLTGQFGASTVPVTYFGAESYVTDIEVDNGAGINSTTGIPTVDYLTGNVSDSPGSGLDDNYGGVSHAVAPFWALSVGANVGTRGILTSTGSPRGYPNGLGVNSYIDGDQANIAIADNSSGALLPSSQRYDVWRILSRGPVPSGVLNAYGPTIATQPDTGDSQSHPVQVANDMVIWISPFTGNQFSTLGTILDPATQTTIESYLNNGGRFFIEGQDIGYALSGGTTAGGAANAFLTNYLKAQFLSDTSGFSTGAYELAAGGGVQNVISNDAYRNATGQREHTSFVIVNEANVFNYLPPYSTSALTPTTGSTPGGAILGLTFQTPTISHTPFSGNVPQEPKDDATTRTDGSLNDGWGFLGTYNNAPIQGNIDGIAPVNVTGSGIVYQSATADLAGSTPTIAVPPTPDTGQDRLLYYFGDVPLTISSATAIPVGATTVSLTVPTGSSAGALLNEFTTGDAFLLDTGTAAETVTVASSTINANGIPVITLTAATTKVHAAGASLTRSASTDFTNYVGFSSFGLETISQEVTANTTYTAMNSDVHVFTSANHRTNILHNLICATRTGTIFGQVTNGNTGQVQPGVLVAASLKDVVTGAVKTYTSISDAGGQYRMEGVLPGLYVFVQTSGGYQNHTVLTTYVHGGDTLRQDINVTPAPTGSVVVNVKDKVTMQPIGGVVVTLTEIHGAFTYTGTTAAATNVNTGAVAGQVTFPTVAPSVYTITYVKAGYDVSNPPDSSGPAQTPTNNVTVTQSPTLVVSTVLSPAPATVFGLVTSVGGTNNGQPLPGATITFTGTPGTFTTTSGPTFPGPDSAPSAIITANYPLNDDATFNLPASPTGVTYTYTVTQTRYVTKTGSITVTSGEALRLNIALVLGGSINLVVINGATGQAISPAVTATLSPASGTITTIVSGAATVPVAPNTTPGYTVTLPASVGGATQTKPVAAGSSVTFTFTVTPAPGTVTGTITDKGTGAPIAGAVVTLTNTNGQTLASAPTGANGVYTIANVPSSRVYSATATAANFTPVTVTSISVTPATTTTQNFALASVFGTLTGTITDSVTNAGVPGATVTITSGTHTYTGTTNASGVYTITGILASASPYTATITGTNYLPKTVTGIVIPADGTLTEPTIVLVSNIIHHYGAGLQMFSAPYDYTGQPLASVLKGEVSKTTGLPVNLVAAWVTLAGAYALTPTSPCETLHLGQGYWARFGATGGQLMATGVADTSATADIPLHAGWNMIGDPYLDSKNLTTLTVQDSAGNTPIPFTTASGASVNFVDPQLYSYNQTSNAYTLVEINNPFGGSQNPTIDPYVGYWIYAYTNCTLIFTK